ncbi:tautomerase family protein [Corynebacterium freiburgense]|uniref:tautomerase family protein n=1 Tax=Corynebacterium freiburgense TaxID=556548 RepID=UPI0003F5917F|nr:tautomerase family protein [Corynebacterium freiburgense]WJZ02941.1 2-hydroxymuconate tautomerase [Corynebacterium freiburgense]
MPIINVTTWEGQDDEIARELMIALTNATREVTGAPLDKITVYIHEVPKNRWAEAGSIGSDPDFPIASRRQQ